MNTSATPTQAQHPALILAARLDSILMSLSDLLLDRLHAVFTIILCNRIVRASRRLTALLTRLAAGRAPRLRPSAAAGQPRAGGPPAPPLPPALRLPRGRLWLFRALENDAYRHNIAARGTQLQTLLHDPATLVLLATAPPAALNSLARTLRPLCRLLGADLPELLRPPAAPPAQTACPQAACP
jgi:hypothetical protein